MVIGVDEVGRGAWAGPLLVVAARQTGNPIAGLKDSKLLTRRQRETIYPLLSTNYQFGEGWVTANEIDHHGVGKAMRIGVERALSALRVLPVEEIIMDGKVDYAALPNSRAVVDADALHPIVSAASIYAKVIRDKFMANLAIKHPGYGFEKHVGYGTDLHKSSISSLGAINDIHRFSYKPVMELAG